MIKNIFLLRKILFQEKYDRICFITFENFVYHLEIQQFEELV